MTATAAEERTLRLDLEGMTCASCAARIEKKLNKLDGVTATVNFATEKAHVVLPPSLTVEQIVGTVDTHEDVDETAGLRIRLLVSAALALPVLVVSMAPPLQFRYWQWVALAL